MSYEWRMRDWCSDVCSSDLGKPHAASSWFGTAGWRSAPERDCDRRPVVRVEWRPVPPSRPAPGRTNRDSRDRAFPSQGRTAGREAVYGRDEDRTSVLEGKAVYVRVILGGCPAIQDHKSMIYYSS